jgi:uncharacterized protein YbaR (Trm112 family)
MHMRIICGTPKGVSRVKRKQLICPECKNKSFDVSVGSEESLFHDNHRTRLIVFKCTECKHEYAMQDDILNIDE